MAGPNSKKRNHQDSGAKSKSQRPNKKQRKVPEYHSDSDEEGTNTEFKPVNLLDSDDEDLDNVAVDDISSGSGSDSNSDSDSDSDSARKPKKHPAKRQDKPAKKHVKDAARDRSPEDELEDEEGKDEDDGESDDDDNDGDQEGDDSDGEDDPTSAGQSKKSKSKRNDPDAFATSMSKILSTKLSSTRRADPVLSRSVEAHKAAKEAVDNALEAKARRHLREQKRLAQEKGRVKDVLVGAIDEDGRPETSTQEIQQTEKRLKKVAHRGVVMLFRAVREAQERAAEAERETRKDGIVGVQRRQEKVNEMSRQGFLDLIAGGGGKLKKGALEEA
ncbi:Rrp15p-domain-containing protein [Daldinia caldariorum]|uniref:Rrp15p-domain-containing protein n=1 Tax=Daldinia caldariorum TaxID=326644 RepID=UPI0020078545|nr:Rrp15p-domain-containing protein [Daldinia caldariorum]KAI1466704.1 Rrp15p-domain-containing protein [Daldinia caldariorum]